MWVEAESDRRRREGDEEEEEEEEYIKFSVQSSSQVFSIRPQLPVHPKKGRGKKKKAVCEERGRVWKE